MPNPIYRFQIIPKGSLIIVRADFASCPTVEGFQYALKPPKFEVTKIPFVDMAMGCHCVVWVHGVNVTGDEIINAVEKIGGSKVVLMGLPGTFAHEAGFNLSKLVEDHKDELAKTPPLVDWLLEREPGDDGIPNRLLTGIIIITVVGLIGVSIGIWWRYGRK